MTQPQRSSSQSAAAPGGEVHLDLEARLPFVTPSLRELLHQGASTRDEHLIMGVKSGLDVNAEQERLSIAAKGIARALADRTSAGTLTIPEAVAEIEGHQRQGLRVKEALRDLLSSAFSSGRLSDAAAAMRLAMELDPKHLCCIIGQYLGRDPDWDKIRSKQHPLPFGCQLMNAHLRTCSEPEFVAAIRLFGARESYETKGYFPLLAEEMLETAARLAISAELLVRTGLQIAADWITQESSVGKRFDVGLVFEIARCALARAQEVPPESRRLIAEEIFLSNRGEPPHRADAVTWVIEHAGGYDRFRAWAADRSVEPTLRTSALREYVSRAAAEESLRILRELVNRRDPDIHDTVVRLMSKPGCSDASWQTVLDRIRDSLQPGRSADGLWELGVIWCSHGTPESVKQKLLSAVTLDDAAIEGIRQAAVNLKLHPHAEKLTLVEIALMPSMSTLLLWATDPAQPKLRDNATFLFEYVTKQDPQAVYDGIAYMLARDPAQFPVDGQVQTLIQRAIEGGDEASAANS